MAERAESGCLLLRHSDMKMLFFLWPRRSLHSPSSIASACMRGEELYRPEKMASKTIVITALGSLWLFARTHVRLAWAGTKSRLKETARLAINCTSCTRVSSSWGVVGQRTFYARFVYRMEIFPSLAISTARLVFFQCLWPKKWTIKTEFLTMILDGSIVVISSNFPFCCAARLARRKHDRRSIGLPIPALESH